MEKMISAQQAIVKGMVQAVTSCDNCENLVTNLIDIGGGVMVCNDCLQDFEICLDCGMRQHREDMTAYSGGYICSDCLDNYSYCEDCGELVETENGYTTGRWNTHFVCGNCYHNNYAECDYCGHDHYREDMLSDNNISVCQRCYDYHYSTCSDCGAIVLQDDIIYDEENEEYYCSDCYQSKPRAIHDYYYKPSPNFLYTTSDGSGKELLNKAFYGVELEIDGAGEDHEKAAAVLQAANSLDEEFIYCKHDGSLRRGFEIVTHPATIQHHMQTFPWSAITKKALELGYSSHKAVTCGLHVHISKVAFGDDWQTQDASLAKFLWLFERFWGQIFLFSRRDMEQLNHYAAKYHKRDYEKADDLLYKAKRAGRFYAVNLQNSNTVEVRVFRGTLKVDTIKASIQFCELFRHIAADYSLHYVQRITWNKIISLAQKLGYSEFVTYCAERGIVDKTK